MAFETGTRLGAYELLEPLGSGGMGEVYAARDTRLGRTVAIKVLRSANLDRPDARTRFQREARAIGSLNHPHICTLHDVGHERGVDFIVMEYVEGETLSARLPRGGLPLREVIQYARDIAAAVDAAHRRGVIHRDLKPSNVMITKMGAKLLDFGLAKLRRPPAALGEDESTNTDDISQDGDVIGTLRYMAPEVLKGDDADARSDLFSFGAVLYEMLTGEPPFKGIGNARIIAAILTEEPRPLLELRSDTPPPLEWIVRTCLAKDPDERFQDAREVVRQLRLIEQTQPSPATPTPMRLSPPRRPRRVTVLMFGSAVVTMGIIAAMMIGRPGTTTLLRAPNDHLAVPHVVVLPCRPIGEVSADDRAQCDGMAATLTAMLATLTTKHVLQVSSTSEVHSRGIASATDARHKLGATLALEGSLMRRPGGVRVTYALVDAATAKQIDALTLDGGGGDAFRLQDALAAWAVGALRLTLDATERVTERRATQSTDAYSFALQGRGYLVDYHRGAALDIAMSLFKRALDADPLYAVAHAGLGEAYWRKFEATKDTGLVEQARGSCRQALNLDPELAAAYVCSATVANGTGDHEAAIVMLERALRIDGGNDAAYRLMARAHEELGRPDAALATYARAVELRPQYWATHVWLANLHRSRGDYADAAREYERAVELTPDNAPVRGILAGMYLFLGRYDDAIAECERSLALMPSDIAYGVLGGSQYRMRRFDDAIVSLEKARSILEDSRTVGNLARAYFWAGRRDRARQLFERAIELGQRVIAVNPRNDEIHVSLADYLARLGRRREALDHLGRARLENPHFMFFAAMVHNQLGDVTQGRQWLDKARAAGLPPAEITGWIDVDNLRR
jgi:tetratricopeptide (TPR) repeat protein/tRNA A-37 threonylcarbamoyl transferase component Bud32